MSVYKLHPKQSVNFGTGILDMIDPQAQRHKVWKFTGLHAKANGQCPTRCSVSPIIFFWTLHCCRENSQTKLKPRHARNMREINEERTQDVTRRHRLAVGSSVNVEQNGISPLRVVVDGKCHWCPQARAFPVWDLDYLAGGQFELLDTYKENVYLLTLLRCAVRTKIFISLLLSRVHIHVVLTPKTHEKAIERRNRKAKTERL